MLDDKMAVVLEKLGTEGITAFYVYLAVDYISLWIFIGLSIWGIRTVWKHEKEKINSK